MSFNDLQNADIHPFKLWISERFPYDLSVQKKKIEVVFVVFFARLPKIRGELGSLQGLSMLLRICLQSARQRGRGSGKSSSWIKIHL